MSISALQAQINTLNATLGSLVRNQYNIGINSGGVPRSSAASLTGISSNSSNTTNTNGLTYFTNQTVVFSNTPMNQTAWTTVPVPSNITGARILIVQVAGSAENTTPQSQLQTRMNSSDTNFLTIAVGVDPAPGNVTNFSFVQQAEIPIDPSAQSFQYQVAGAAGSCFSNLTLTVIGYK